MTTINRNKCRMWFITFPQSGTYSPEEFLDKLFARRTVTGVAGVQETHEDGSPHIHLNIKLEFGLTKSQILNSCRIKFPEDYKRIDIRSTRQHYKNADYLHKEGEVFLWERPGLGSRAKRRAIERNLRSGYQDLYGVIQTCLGHEWELDIEKTLAKYDDIGKVVFQVVNKDTEEIVSWPDQNE